MTQKTNKNTLSNGLIKLLVTLFLLITGPIFISLAVSNKEKSLFIPLLILGCLLCILAIYQGFKGLTTIVKSLYNES